MMWYAFGTSQSVETPEAMAASAPAAFAAADAAYASGDVAGALRLCEALALAAPDSVPLLVRRSRWTVASMRRGSDFGKMLERAEADARRAVALEPRSFAAHKAVAVALQKKADVATGTAEKVAL